VRWEYYAVAILAILFMGLIVLVTMNSSQGFSKVYFDNVTIPEYIVPNTSYDVVFIIESHEHKVTEYNYQVYLNGTLLLEGNVSLNPGQVVQVPVRFVVDNLSNHTTVVWERTTFYELDGVTGVVGRICDSVNISNSNDSIGVPRGDSPPAYVGPSNLSFLLNVSKNFTITKTVTYHNAGESIVLKYHMVFINVGGGVYKVIVTEKKIVTTPASLMLRVVVESSAGKTYQIFRVLPGREG